MFSKNELKLIKSLQIKKYRQETGLFVVEGLKSVLELLHSDWEIVYLAYTKEAAAAVEQCIHSKISKSVCVSQKEMAQMSGLEQNSSVLAVVKMERPILTDNFFNPNNFVLVLDAIQDPGNLGTILRTADWFGVKHIVCSKNCVDVYNPKTIQASMGSFLRVVPVYTDLIEYVENAHNAKCISYALVLDGDDIRTISKPGGGIICLGSEAHGIGVALRSKIHQSVRIPGSGNAESLNVAVATGITLFTMISQT